MSLVLLVQFVYLSCSNLVFSLAMDEFKCDYTQVKPIKQCFPARGDD